MSGMNFFQLEHGHMDISVDGRKYKYILEPYKRKTELSTGSFYSGGKQKPILKLLKAG